MVACKYKGDASTPSQPLTVGEPSAIGRPSSLLLLPSESTTGTARDKHTESICKNHSDCL